MATLKHDDGEATNHYRCPDCGRRWATGDDVPEGFQDACPACSTTSWPLKHGLSEHQRFAVYWTYVFAAGWGFGFAIGLSAGSDTWWWPLW